MSKQKSSFGQSDIVRLSDEDAAVALLERAVTGLWEVVNDLTRFRRTTRQNYRVTIFGSARLEPDTVAYKRVKQLAAELTKMGCDIVSGGGPGIMRAANEGAHSVDPKGYTAPWVFAWTFRSSRSSIHSSAWLMNTVLSSRVCTTS
jgi:hypothetical protein